MRKIRFLVWVMGASLAFGRGESWMPKPPAPPSVATLTNEARYVEWKFRGDVTDPSTGLAAHALRTNALALASGLEPKEDWRVVKAKVYAMLCDQMAIDVSPLDWYPAISIWNRYDRPMSAVVWRRNGEIARKCYPDITGRINKGNRDGIWRVWKDFDHSVPVWEDMFKLGFAGMRDRVDAHDDGTPFYRSLRITADASIRLIERFAAQARKRLGTADGKSSRLVKQIAALDQLAKGPPQTAYEVLLFIDLYFFMCEHLDAMQCRSLSIIDRNLWPYYQADLAAGRTTEAEFREQFRHFLWQWGSVDNYWGQPVTMGGTKADGTTEYNPLSRIILDVMDECALPTPKFHVKIGKSTPREILDKLLSMARRNRSLTFIGEESARRILEHYGATKEEARTFYTTGCYEIVLANGANKTGVGYINLLKQVEFVLRDAKGGKFSAADYAAFQAECIRRMVNVCTNCLAITSAFEQHLDDVNPANITTLGVAYAVKTGRDAFANGSERGNNTAILIAAMGTTVDALVAVKDLVYEKKEMSLADLGKLMAANWEGRDDLRLRMKRSKRKWGNNDPDANATAAAVSKALAAAVNGKPNARGGIYVLSGHSARAFIYEGAATGATPDGRKAGEEFSKNMSATMGADTEGVTALIQTLGALDSRDWPGDFPLDVMLHPATVEGDRGLALMRTLLDVYYANGGLQIQFVVVSADELRDAQKHPEKYENLQIRVCGWNVRWNDIPKAEQDAYILRAESIMQ
ncbi:MAG TPA: pyruvate formate lyase family protein [Kiritimatiellia bacterium]|nr:pyruvate formate lyase family protein [Kiritimatiellia bacterium]HOM58410.1 pyruvate formate lyase family protein [Kiritimatiellia bacterium]HOR97280.1 pyruvate formate lyase family protein [Kiritimatiellia bacterium]HPC48564.1 pyruvate formate lyase family protein [Kiritimatiellia bacterium]HPK36647.1 pyruvate formate lyase family protein [Kiritimatiellia bacterium]